MLAGGVPTAFDARGIAGVEPAWIELIFFLPTEISGGIS
jgi:hypothetical protein